VFFSKAKGGLFRRSGRDAVYAYEQVTCWSRVELIVIDELGYVPLAEVAAELLFQVIAERAENAAIKCDGRNR
jgi:DNA replication protein DnaC